MSHYLESPQQAAVLVGFPFAIVMLFMCYSLYKALRVDYREQDEQEEEEEEEEEAEERPAGRAVEAPTGEPTPTCDR